MRFSCRILVALLALCGFALAASNPAPFVTNPLVPTTATPGSAGFELTVNGSGFVSASVVNWNGSPRATTFISSSKLQATILSTDVASVETAYVTVSSPAPGGGKSAAATFNVVFPSPSVAFTSTTTNETKNCDITQKFPQVVADFNGDGKLDVAGSVCAGGYVYVTLGNGDGTFQAAQLTAIIPNAVYTMVAGDFNADGKMDIAVVNDNNIVSVLLGNGDGTFQPEKTYLTGIYPYSMATADVNGDGKLDLVLAANTDNAIDVLLGNGDGTFQPFLASPTGGVNPYGVVIADFNGDGKLDVATGEGSEELTIMLGNGDGTFRFSTDIFVYFSPIAAVDINGDGKVDLFGTGVALNGSEGGASYMLGNGDGTFQDPVIIPATPTNENFFQVGVADLNGDGKLDFWAAARYGENDGDSIYSFLGNGDGTFQSPIIYPITTAGYVSGSIVEGDFNNDGKPDFVDANDCLGTYCTLVALQSPVVASPTALAFGTKLIGHPAKALPLTLTNAGPSAVALSTITFTGSYAKDFSQTNNCPASLASQASCTIQVTFTPSTENFLESATMVVPEGTSGGSLQITLGGEGTYIRESPASLSFGNVAVGQSSSQNVTLMNTDKFALEVSKIYVATSPFGREFSETNTCGGSLAAGAQCTITVTFSPPATGHASAKIDIDFFNDTPPPIQATGTGTAN
jgi:FG-GAP-like repeat/Abnormal spindle-like microcephaly-assoc'd, ASPM-SPD-2-Hydin